jgi:phage terminase large subunit GpA-like protein
VVRDAGKLQVFYNNVLAEPWEVHGAKVSFTVVSSHRRSCYARGQVPNRHAEQWCGSPVLFLTCTVDVHKSNLAVAVWGWTRDARSYLVDYWRFEDSDCERTDSPAWSRLREVVEEREWVADDGARYRVVLTLVDAGWSHDTVLAFCGDYEAGVYPVLGRERTAKHQRIQEFAEFKTQAGTVGYRILVDHYKDRLAPVLRREWRELDGPQRRYHFNAPLDLPDDAIKELTREVRREKRDERGVVSYQWHRPGNVPNELWDLLVYGHASVEILAWSICVRQFGLDTVDWPRFWDWVEGGKVFNA